MQLRRFKLNHPGERGLVGALGAVGVSALGALLIQAIVPGKRLRVSEGSCGSENRLRGLRNRQGPGLWVGLGGGQSPPRG